ncbi:MAG: PEP-CTERM sorting domain-containing protein [Leptolyngbya sp. PLA3]|nr:MAG: PEP-CTERM sorting domain-containing protein [Cyanobacteria bacterium CYA]MCE7969982.1 PEP-CTERM sorting domain-containing protein [Leptolyngbya sp. PL-A3]
MQSVLSIIALAGIASLAQADVIGGAGGYVPTINGRTVVNLTPYATVSHDRDLGAGTMYVDFGTALPSVDGIGDFDNFIAAIDINVVFGTTPGAAVTVFGIGWDVEISTMSPSYLSDAALLHDDYASMGDAAAFVLTPGVANPFPGTATYSSGGMVDLTVDVGLPNLVLDTGVLYLEFFEWYDDFASLTDAYWSPGLARLYYSVSVPAPGAVALIGLGGLTLARRRR